MRSTIRFGMLASLACAAAGALFVEACDDSVEADKVAADSGAADSTADTATTPTADTGTPASDAGADAPAVGAINFTVPAGGGNVDVNAGGVKLTFTFPASAAGKNIVLTPTDAAGVGWTGAPFLGVVKLEPAGERFANPIVIKPGTKGAVGTMLAFPNSTAQGPASPLKITSTGDGFELTHFTALALLPPDKVCDSQGHQDTPCSSRCSSDTLALDDAGVCRGSDGGVAAAGSTTFRQVTCKGYTYCVIVNGSCCVDPSVDSGTACTLENQKYGISYTPSGNNGSINYCEGNVTSLWDGGDAGCGQAKPNYSFGANGACSAILDCGPIYRLDCDGTNCTCKWQNADGGTTTFQQADTCDTTATMKKAYAEKCAYPL